MHAACLILERGHVSVQICLSVGVIVTGSDRAAVELIFIASSRRVHRALHHVRYQ